MTVKVECRMGHVTVRSEVNADAPCIACVAFEEGKQLGRQLGWGEHQRALADALSNLKPKS